MTAAVARKKRDGHTIELTHYKGVRRFAEWRFDGNFPHILQFRHLVQTAAADYSDFYLFHACVRSGEHEASFRLRYFAAKLLCPVHPFLNDDLGVCKRFLICFSIGHASGKFWNFGNVSVAVMTPINNYFVLTHQSLLSRTLRLYYELDDLVRSGMHYPGIIRISVTHL